jgi:hypothetical protein
LASSSKHTSKNQVGKTRSSTKKVGKTTPTPTVAKSNGKESVRQRPHLSPSTLNDNNNDMFSSDEDDQTEAVATDSRITYAIAMNRSMAQEGCSNSGRNIGSGSGSGTNASSEQPVTTNTVARYPKRVRRHVDYNEQLNPTDDDSFICKSCIISYRISEGIQQTSFVVSELLFLLKTVLKLRKTC